MFVGWFDSKIIQKLLNVCTLTWWQALTVNYYIDTQDMAF